ncbi:MAG: DNA-processing protein DprA [Hyphomicrobiales bacterium]
MQRLLTDAQRVDWLRLIRSENVGPLTFRALVNRFGGAGEALDALPKLYRKGGKQGGRICTRAEAQESIDRASSIGARFVAIGEPGYPVLLRQTERAPILLCLKGNEALLERTCLAVVGARNASALGMRFTRDLAAQVGRGGITIVSGLARGIDTAAHEASLATGTVAVLAGGIDVVYPPENAKLQAAIGERGLLISEHAPGTVPLAKHFPQRNRIIAGVSVGVVVMEAALRSGSLITARLAAEQGREVFAVPGSPLDPRSSGTNRLIQDGAQLVASIEDVLDGLKELQARPDRERDYFMQAEEANEANGHPEVPDDLYGRLLGLMGHAPVEIDDLIRESGAPANLVVAALLELELAGRIARHAGQRVSLAVPQGPAPA